MTPNQLAALDLVREGLTGPGVAPTIREIGRRLNVTPSNAHRIVSGLVETGQLRRTAAKTRGLALVNQPDLRAVDSQALRNELARRGETLTALSTHEPRTYGRRGVSCAADSCQIEVRRGHLFCRRHWFALPRDLQSGILQAFGARDADRYQALVAEARDIADGRGAWK